MITHQIEVLVSNTGLHFKVLLDQPQALPLLVRCLRLREESVQKISVFAT